MATRKTVGTGITSKAVTTYDMDAPGDVEECFGQWRGFGERLDGFEASAKKVLAAAGLPTEPGRWYRRDGDAWTMLPRLDLSNPPAAASLGLERVVKHAGHEVDSAAGYAASALEELLSLRRAIAAKNALLAAELGISLGRLITEAQMKRRWERPALAGEKCRRAGKDSGRHKTDRDVMMAREFERRLMDHGGHKSKSAIMEEIGAKHGLKRRAAIDAINRGLKKTVQDPATCTE